MLNLANTFRPRSCRPVWAHHADGQASSLFGVEVLTWRFGEEDVNGDHQSDLGILDCQPAITWGRPEGLHIWVYSGNQVIPRVSVRDDLKSDRTKELACRGSTISVSMEYHWPNDYFMQGLASKSETSRSSLYSYAERVPKHRLE